MLDYDSLREAIKQSMMEITIDGVSFSGYKPAVDGEIGVSVTGTIYKSDDERQVVYGFASVIEVNGEPVVDLHGDVIEEDDLVEAAEIFMSEYRSGKEMHKGSDVGEVVQSFVFTKEIQKALGIDLGFVGWVIGYKVHKKEVWEKVKKGDLAMFSIGGSAKREVINE